MDRKGFVEVDGLCRTNVPGVYAIGDINGKMQLAHVASAQGLLVADHIAGKPCKQLHYERIPLLCLLQSRDRHGGPYRGAGPGHRPGTVGVGTFSLSGNGKALTMGENKASPSLSTTRPRMRSWASTSSAPGPRTWRPRWPRLWSARHGGGDWPHRSSPPDDQRGGDGGGPRVPQHLRQRPQAPKIKTDRPRQMPGHSVHFII